LPEDEKSQKDFGLKQGKSKHFLAIPRQMTLKIDTN